LAPWHPLRAAPLALWLVLGLPVLAGLAGVIGPSFGYMPALGARDWTLAHWAALQDWPGLWQSLRVTLLSGVLATVLSLAITFLIVAALQGSRAFDWLTRALAPLLAIPHAAAAFGLAFVIAPSGWVARALSPWATGWDRPPDVLILNDPYGLSLVAGLVVKEVPFLLLMTLAALGQADSLRAQQVAQSLGYGRVTGWAKVVAPRVYPQLRLPVYAVLAYSLSVVDVALILGPTRPPTLAVQVLEWMNAPDLGLRLRASAGACLLMGLVIAVLAVWVLAERMLARFGRAWAANGVRGLTFDRVARPTASALVLALGVAMGLGMGGLALWSLAGQWQFPALWPQSISLRAWETQAPALQSTALRTALIAALATLAALALSLAVLEHAHRRGAALRAKNALIFAPLVVPQIVFVPGLASFALMLGWDGTVAAVVALHLIFVLPYLLLSLSDPWRAWDGRAGLVAASLGASPARILWAVRLPMLLRALAIACAVGFATSVAQYLPTLLIGAGRVPTLTTEAVALSSSSNRRLIGVWALAQMVLPMAVFAAALALPAYVARHRAGLRVT
jgi:putative thiamine transport system permease protein